MGEKPKTRPADSLRIQHHKSSSFRLLQKPDCEYAPWAVSLLQRVWYKFLAACRGKAGTIHLATQKVDAGSILSQVRPDSLKPDDNAHDMGTKTIIAGLKKMGEIIPGYLNEEIRLHKQDLSAGKVFRRKDFNAGAVLKMWEHLENGMISDYLKNKENRDKNYPIIEQ
jgi:hypothetical protein